MKIVERAMNNCYLGDGTVHPGDHLHFIHELCKLFKCAGISTCEVKRKLFSLSLKCRAAEWYKTLKDGRPIGWEEIVPLFYSKFYPSSEIHKDRNYIYNFQPHEEKARYDYNMPPIFDDSGDENNYFVEFSPTTIAKNDYVHVGVLILLCIWLMRMFYVIVILLILFMILLKVIMREGNVV
jgi:hypothetical protein